MARVVLFDEKGVRIFHADDVKDLAPYLHKKNCLIDPVYPRGVPPHLWRLKDGKIAVKESLELAKASTKNLSLFKRLFRRLF